MRQLRQHRDWRPRRSSQIHQPPARPALRGNSRVSPSDLRHRRLEPLRQPRRDLAHAPLAVDLAEDGLPGLVEQRSPAPVPAASRRRARVSWCSRTPRGSTGRSPRPRSFRRPQPATPRRAPTRPAGSARASHRPASSASSCAQSTSVLKVSASAAASCFSALSACVEHPGETEGHILRCLGQPVAEIAKGSRRRRSRSALSSPSIRLAWIAGAKSSVSDDATASSSVRSRTNRT